MIQSLASMRYGAAEAALDLLEQDDSCASSASSSYSGIDSVPCIMRPAYDSPHQYDQERSFHEKAGHRNTKVIALSTAYTMP